MWQKRDNIGIWIWSPKQYVFSKAFAVFTAQNNLLAPNISGNAEAINKLLSVSQNASIIVFENVSSLAQLETISVEFEKFVMDVRVPMVAIFSYIKNRYSKPYTGGFEYIMEMANATNATNAANAANATNTSDITQATYKFCPEFSIMVANNIGLISVPGMPNGKKNASGNGSKYIDRAFAHNIGIEVVISPDIFFINDTQRAREWSWPIYLLSNKQKNKLFYGEIEPLFTDFINLVGRNIICITGPPSSGKTILARRIFKILPCDIFEGTMPPAAIAATKSLIYIIEAPTYEKKQNIISTLNKFCGQDVFPNLVWIEMSVPRTVVEFLRHLKVQLGRHSNPILAPVDTIRKYYTALEFKDLDIPSNITHINFPLVLKKIPELNYIF